MTVRVRLRAPRTQSRDTPAQPGEFDANRLRRLEREWQDEVGHALLDKPFETPGSALVFQRQFERITQALGDELGPGPIVDVGCGRGQFLEYLRTTGFGDRLLMGIDVSIAVDALPAREVTALRADGEYLPFRDQTIAAVIYNGSLHHIVDYRAALREALRVLRPSGRLVVFEPVTSAFSRVVHRLLDPVVFRTNCEYESPVDQHLKHAFREAIVVDELRKNGADVHISKSDFLAYPFTGCYAGSFFTRSSQLMRGLLAVEKAVERAPGLGLAARVFAWRFLLVADKPHTAAESYKGETLWEIIACPRCKGRLSAEGGEAFVCPHCRLKYPIDRGVPRFLLDEAEAR